MARHEASIQLRPCRGERRRTAASAPRQRAAARRGLTLLEFMLAIAITALVAGAMSAMMHAVAQATQSDEQFRQTIVRSQAINVRLSSYITPALKILDSGASSLVVWLDDTRAGDTIHSTEVRWIDWDAGTQTVRMRYVSFPPELSQIERDALDAELPLASDWWLVLSTLETAGYIATLRLCDEVAAFDVERNDSTAQGARVLTAIVTYTDDVGGQTVVAGASIRDPKEPQL